MGNWRTGERWSDVEGGTWLKESWGAKKCDGNGWWGMGGGQGAGHDGMRGEGAWLRNREGWRDADGKWVGGRKKRLG